jgi:hypothetical protein
METEKPDDEVARIAAALAAPFSAAEVQFKPAVVQGNRALALAYVDARAVMDRLDDVLGIAGWRDAYRVLPDGCVMCRLSLLIGGRWLTKADVGSPSEQPDGGDRTKAAFSDSLKRAAARWGIARYLGRLPATWADYDAKKREFVRPPVLPDTALPKPVGAAGAAKITALAVRKGADPLALLNAADARGLWVALSALPDKANGTPVPR